MSKGSWYRTHTSNKYRKNWDDIFGTFDGSCCGEPMEYKQILDKWILFCNKCNNVKDIRNDNVNKNA